MRQAAIVPALLAFTVLTAAAGCRFEKKNTASDKTGDVKFATPFGNLSVKTDENVVQDGAGLSVYPGATLVHKQKDSKDQMAGHDDGAADVNMSFGSFHLGVKALNYTTPDAPDKVLAFYRKDMAHYGTVVLCRGNQPVGQPTHTQDGLGCETDSHKNIHLSDDSDEQLKAGSRMHQHIVAVRPQAGGTHIGLVALDLPGNLGSGDDDSKE